MKVGVNVGIRHYVVELTWDGPPYGWWMTDCSPWPGKDITRRLVHAAAMELAERAMRHNGEGGES